MELTKEITGRILAKRMIVSAPGRVVGARMVNISSQVFEWETTGDDYVIGNTNLLTDYLEKEVRQLVKEGKYQEATNKNLSVRLSLDEAEQIGKNALIQCEIERIPLKSGEEALMIKTGTVKIAPAVKTRAFTMEEEMEEEMEDVEIEIPELKETI